MAMWAVYAYNVRRQHPLLMTMMAILPFAPCEFLGIWKRVSNACLDREGLAVLHHYDQGQLHTQWPISSKQKR